MWRETQPSEYPLFFLSAAHQLLGKWATFKSSNCLSKFRCFFHAMFCFLFHGYSGFPPENPDFPLVFRFSRGYSGFPVSPTNIRFDLTRLKQPLNLSCYLNNPSIVSGSTNLKQACVRRIRLIFDILEAAGMTSLKPNQIHGTDMFTRQKVHKPLCITGKITTANRQKPLWIKGKKTTAEAEGALLWLWERGFNLVPWAKGDVQGARLLLAVPPDIRIRCSTRYVRWKLSLKLVLFSMMTRLQMNMWHCLTLLWFKMNTT